MLKVCDLGPLVIIAQLEPMVTKEDDDRLVVQGGGLSGRDHCTKVVVGERGGTCWGYIGTIRGVRKCEKITASRYLLGLNPSHIKVHVAWYCNTTQK